ncbi:MAG: SRPBCC family protein [Acidimicrobiia bacterium]|nr:SRPBCC family protein [Acidimicrobiia bacterium]
MIRFIGQLEVDDPPAYVFDLLADMSVLHHWNPNVRTSRRVSGERFEPGSRYESTIARGPVRMTARSELVTVDPGRKVEYEGSILWFWSVDWLTFEPAGNGTRIIFENETQAPRWLGPFNGLLNAAFQRQATRAVEGARRYLASPH